jgi:hypothetical protein
LVAQSHGLTINLLFLHYGARTLEVVEGKNAIETDSIAGVVTTLEVLRSAVDDGELDCRNAMAFEMMFNDCKPRETVEKYVGAS